VNAKFNLNLPKNALLMALKANELHIAFEKVFPFLNLFGSFGEASNRGIFTCTEIIGESN